MQNPAFHSIAHKLQVFLAQVCTKLSEGNPDAIERAFRGKHKSIDRMELREYCLLIERNIDGHRDRDLEHCVLFNKHRFPKHFFDDIRFIGGLRNKYFHLKGLACLHSNDELGDLLVVERVVNSLSEKCESNSEFAEFRNELTKKVRDLNWHVAQVNDPELDCDEVERRLTDADGEYLSSIFRELLVVSRPRGEAEHSTEVISQSDDIHILQTQITEQLIRIDRKLAPLKSLKKQVDAVRSGLMAEIAEVRGIVQLVDQRWNEKGVEGSDEVESDDWDEMVDGGVDDGNEYVLAETIKIDVAQVLEQLKLHYPTINSWQARDELIRLRKRIWKETGGGPTADGLLRKRMIDEFLYHRPGNSCEAYNCGLGPYLRSVAPEQIQYLDDVCSIVRRIEVTS